MNHPHLNPEVPVPAFRFPLSAFRFPLSAFRFPRTITGCVLALLVGCAEPITTVPADDGGPPPLRAALIGACTQGLFTQFNAQQWTCGSQVNFYTGVTALKLPLQTAVGEWRARLQSTGFSELPTFETTDNPAGAQATATGTGTGGPFCGLWSTATKNLTVNSGSGCGGTASTGPLHNLLLHELGHAVGWTGSSTHRVFRTPAADHCVMHLPEDLTINGSVCVHEVEGALAGYGLVSYDGGSFFDTPFVVGSANSLPSLTLAIGQSASLSPGALVLEPKPELGGGDDAQVIADDVVPGTENAYWWSSSASTVASVSGGLVTAQSPGTAVITAIPMPGTGYLLAHPFRLTGRSATITVPAPPPPAKQILLDEVPVHTAGWHTLSFVGPGTPGPLTWTIDDSRTTTINPDAVLSSSGWSVAVFIEEGSYTLRVSTAGIIQDFPVCTGSGGGGGGGGGEGTDAVAGCAPPSSEEEEE